MTYFAFLGIFLAPPLLLLLGIAAIDNRAGRELPVEFQTWKPWRLILFLVVVAVLYTTPWDNYLVATRVWWYDPALVSGLVLGWVPIEEYTFFVLQTIMTGLWVVWLMRHWRESPRALSGLDWARSNRFRWLATAALVVLWLLSVLLLIIGPDGGTYLALELSWALPPILLQMAFGGDILWRHRWLVLWAIAIPTVYLCIGDAIAIGAGTWTISPEKSTQLLVGNLPVEEILFFLITNTLVVFGMVLFLAQMSHRRAPASVLKWMSTLLGSKVDKTDADEPNVDEPNEDEVNVDEPNEDEVNVDEVNVDEAGAV